MEKDKKSILEENAPDSSGEGELIRFPSISERELLKKEREAVKEDVDSALYQLNPVDLLERIKDLADNPVNISEDELDQLFQQILFLEMSEIKELVELLEKLSRNYMLCNALLDTISEAFCLQIKTYIFENRENFLTDNSELLYIINLYFPIIPGSGKWVPLNDPNLNLLNFPGTATSRFWLKIDLELTTLLLESLIMIMENTDPSMENLLEVTMNRDIPVLTVLKSYMEDSYPSSEKVTCNIILYDDIPLVFDDEEAIDDCITALKNSRVMRDKYYQNVLLDYVEEYFLLYQMYDEENDEMCYELVVVSTLKLSNMEDLELFAMSLGEFVF